MESQKEPNAPQLLLPPPPPPLLITPPPINDNSYDFALKRKHMMQINGQQQYGSTKQEVEKKLIKNLEKAEENSKESESTGEGIVINESQYTLCTRCNKSVLTTELPTHMSCHAAIILDNLLLGDKISAQSRKELIERNKVTHVVNAAYELPNYLEKEGVKYFQLELFDTLDEQLENEVEKAYQFIRNAHQEGGVVFVHCAVGKSRSVSVILTYLLKEKGIGIQKGLAMVKQKRPVAQPNKSYMTQLLEYERKHLSNLKEKANEPKTEEKKLESSVQLSEAQRVSEPRDEK